MEKEILNLKRQLASVTRNTRSENATQSGALGYNNLTMDQYGSREAVAGLLDLRSGIDSLTGFARSPARQSVHAKVIENVVVPKERISELFNRYECILGVGFSLLIRFTDSSLTSIPSAHFLAQTRPLSSIMACLNYCSGPSCMSAQGTTRLIQTYTHRYVHR